MLLASIAGVVLLQLKQTNQRLAWNQALHTAEAGLHYYRWCLNNAVEDNCQLEKEHFDIEGDSLGEFFLEDFTNYACGEMVSRKIISTGWTNKFPDTERKVSIFYSRSSITGFSYLTNSNVWVEAGTQVKGVYRSNAGIRMDGKNKSSVLSATSSWLCTASYGCDYLSCPSDCSREGSACRCPGIFTTTKESNPDLFSFPVEYFDFNAITIDLRVIKDITSSHPLQYYWPPVTEVDPVGLGYHLKFLTTGGFEVWIITNLTSTYAYSAEEGWHYDSFVISGEYRYGGEIAIDPNCALIFVEDNLWVEGTITGKVTVASADLVVGSSKDTSIILPGDISYHDQGQSGEHHGEHEDEGSGSDGLALISEKNILIGPNAPNEMKMYGIFVAQKGRFGINHYPSNIKVNLKITGSIVSSNRIRINWASGGKIISGFKNYEHKVDSNVIYSPPLFVPYTGSDFRIVGWEEI
jgi:hypothetical protein